MNKGTLIAAAMVAGSLCGVASASSVIYSNAFNNVTGQMTGYITGVTTGAMQKTGNPATVIVPFRTAGNAGESFILDSIRIWTTNLTSTMPQPTFRIFADDPTKRPSTYQTGTGSTAQRWFDPTTNNLTQIYSWQTQFSDAANTTDTSDFSLPYATRNYTYDVATPLELDAGTLYWFAVTAARAQVFSNFGWRQTKNEYNPDGFDVTSHLFELGGSNIAVVPLPPAAWAGLATLAGVAGCRRLRRRG